MPAIHQKKRTMRKRPRRQRSTVQQKVKSLLTRLGGFPQEYFNERDLVSLDVITEISNNGIAKIEHFRILERVLNNVSVTQKEKKIA